MSSTISFPFSLISGILTINDYFSSEWFFDTEGELKEGYTKLSLANMVRDALVLGWNVSWKRYLPSFIIILDRGKIV